MNIEQFIPFFSNWGILISYLGGLFGGEEAVLTLSFLSANELLPLWWVIVFTTIGVYTSDLIFFFIGRFHLIKNFKNLERFSKTYQKIDEIIEKLSNRKIFLTLLYTKFIYGARILTLIYLGTKEKNTKKFLIYNLIVVYIWSTIYIFLGFLAGNGFKIILSIFKNFQIALTGLIIFLIIIYITRKLINIFLLKMKRNLN